MGLFYDMGEGAIILIFHLSIAFDYNQRQWINEKKPPLCRNGFE
jgi:hypothetical protein